MRKGLVEHQIKNSKYLLVTTKKIAKKEDQIHKMVIKQPKV